LKLLVFFVLLLLWWTLHARPSTWPGLFIVRALRF